MITTFGEMMLRLSPSIQGERISQALQFRVEPGGSEANVAIALANLGRKTAFVTSLPDNELSRRIILFLNQFSIDTNHIKLGGGRLGIYWTENGVGPRRSSVIYDRESSSFSEIDFSDFEWRSILEGTDWFHTSGITPAVSRSAYTALLQVLKLVDGEYHIPISIDLNFRSKLWNWVKGGKKEMQSIMRELCSYCTLICGNESDFAACLNLSSTKRDEDEQYSEVASQCFDEFPSVKFMGVSLRKSLSATINLWSGFLFVKDEKNFSYRGTEFNIDNIVDRVGSGDSFAAGILYGLASQGEFSYQKTIDFSVTLSALKHTTIGDASRFSVQDVNHAMETKGSGKIVR